MKLDEGGQVYGAGLLLKHLDALAGEFEGVLQGGADIEYIHRMRVATRRLRATLPLFADSLPAKGKSRAWLSEIRKITSALGEARDADVQIEHLQEYLSLLSDPLQRAGVERLLLRLRQKRAGLQPHLVKALDRLRGQDTLGEMRAALEPLAARAQQVYIHTRALYLHSCGSIQPCLDAFLGYDAIVPDPTKVTELHAMRIAAKRLRYTLEAFASLYSGELKKWLIPVRDAQETLGTIHDCDVWTGLIPLYLQEERERVRMYYGHTRPYPRLVPGVIAYGAVRKAEREDLHAQFVQIWETWKGKELWTELSRALRMPLQSLAGIYPPRPEPSAEVIPEEGFPAADEVGED